MLIRILVFALVVCQIGFTVAADDGADQDSATVECPVPPFGGGEQIAWSPAGDEIAFTVKDVDDWAESPTVMCWSSTSVRHRKRGISRPPMQDTTTTQSILRMGVSWPIIHSLLRGALCL